MNKLLDYISWFFYQNFVRPRVRKRKIKELRGTLSRLASGLDAIISVARVKFDDPNSSNYIFTKMLGTGAKEWQTSVRCWYDGFDYPSIPDSVLFSHEGAYLKAKEICKSIAELDRQLWLLDLESWWG